MLVHFILVNPARGENVGFTARALKTMGFNSLRIVGEPLQNTKAARKTGYGAHDILDSALNYTSLDQALSDIDLSIATTSKVRIKRYDCHAPHQIGEILHSKIDIMEQIGLVFGSEENGLSTTELDQCDLISTIPLTNGYPSLNLAQSALIYAWVLRNLAGGKHQISNDKSQIASNEEPVPSIKEPEPSTKNQVPGTSAPEPEPRSHPSPRPANPSLQGLIKEETKQLLNQLGVLDKPLLAQRIMDRVMLLNSDDSELLMTILTKIKRDRSD